MDRLENLSYHLPVVKIIEGSEDAVGLNDEIEPEYDLANTQIDIERTLKFRAKARARLIALDPDLLAESCTPPVTS